MICFHLERVEIVSNAAKVLQFILPVIIFYGNGGQNRRRLAPLFPVATWNVHDRVETDIPRTNNSLEGFHNAFQSSILNTHPNLWKLLKALRKEESLAATRVLHRDKGDSKTSKKKYTTLNTRLTTLVKNYDGQNKLQYLRSIAYNLHSF